jgi:Rieske Fe-S protein
MSSLPLFDGESASACAPSAEALPLSVDRRGFLAQSTLAAIGAMLAGACGNGLGGSNVTGPTGVNVTVTLSSYSALGSVGGIARLSGVSTPIAVVRNATSTYRAFSLICPHQGTTVNVSGSAFVCPNHGAQFNATGANTGGERTSSLFEFSVAHDATAGTLTITS